MQKFIFFMLFISLPFCVNAQKEDYIMLSGYGNYGHAQYPEFGGCKIDFNTTPETISYDDYDINFDATYASICSPEGRFLFCTNGATIRDSTNQKMMNSDSINETPLGWGYGFRTIQSHLILPLPNHSTKYYLFHQYPNYDPTRQFVQAANHLRLSEIDMTLNNGRGAVTQLKADTIYPTRLNVGLLTACRHANGRDWWVTAQDITVNKMLKWRLTPNGLENFSIQVVSPQPHYQGDSGWNAVYSPDGRKFAYFDILEGIGIMDFDRCTGEFSNKIVIPTDTLKWVGSVTISPNSQYLYFINSDIIIQYDLQSANIPMSGDTVARYDGFTYTVRGNNYATYFFQSFLTPNNKIYINCWNASLYHHVIENPDVRGIGCNVQQHSILLPTLSSGTTPNFPNFRLGKLAGSPCDTLVVATDKNPILENLGGFMLFPNPAANNTRLVWYTPLKNNAKVELVNMIGQIIEILAVESGVTYQDIDLKNLPNGIYFIRLSATENQAYTTKLIKISD